MSEQVVGFKVRTFLPIQHSSNTQSLLSGSLSVWPGTSQSCISVWGSYYSTSHHSLALLRDMNNLHHSLRLFLPSSVYSTIIFHRWSSLKISCAFISVLDTASEGPKWLSQHYMWLERADNKMGFGAWSIHYYLVRRTFFHMVDGAQIVSQIQCDVPIHEDYSHGDLGKWSSGGTYNCQSEDSVIWKLWDE